MPPAQFKIAFAGHFFSGWATPSASRCRTAFLLYHKTGWKTHLWPQQKNLPAQANCVAVSRTGTCSVWPGLSFAAFSNHANEFALKCEGFESLLSSKCKGVAEQAWTISVCPLWKKNDAYPMPICSCTFSEKRLQVCFAQFWAKFNLFPLPSHLPNKNTICHDRMASIPVFANFWTKKSPADLVPSVSTSGSQLIGTSSKNQAKIIQLGEFSLQFNTWEIQVWFPEYFKINHDCLFSD